ncbi:MAG: T9SS C-terminal target domain-containing protein [Calditrichaeota bacterium]|nr:MAG: T9SS C-terminal target domain-containing protein [Calditrichota bacterium]
MNKSFLVRSLMILFAVISVSSVFPQTEYHIDANAVQHQIDPKVYGHFLEHIYNSVNGGLWGELIWNRSFERFSGASGSWHMEGDEVVQTSLNENVRLLIGETTWKDYEFTLEARKDDGAEGFLIIFRASGENFYWCNLGGWGNTQHAIEKGTPGVRWGVFGNPLSGSISSNQWYTIRIRCEGKHFQVWLDHIKIFDFIDNAAHLTGQVGIGTWLTKARYRNCLVTDIPSGTVLFAGLPTIVEQEATPQNWVKVGLGKMYRSEQALNSHYCVKVVNTTAEKTGLQQRSINFINQSYHGTFWAKGSTPSDLTVQLLSGLSVIAQQTFDTPTKEWQEYSFDLSPTVATINGSLQITYNDTGTVFLDQISMMGQDAVNNDGFRPDLFEAVNDLHPPAIRWPGGYFAEFYRWKDGIGPQHVRGIYPLEAWNDQDVNSFGTDEFLTLCRRFGAEPIMVINIGHRSFPVPQQAYIEEAQHWIEYCNGPENSPWGAVRAVNGHPAPYNVKYWEISNEVWLTRDANTYVDFIKAFVPALKQIDPSIKIVACGSGGFDQNWNRTILDNCADMIDYISTHHYEDIANYKTGVRNYDNFLKTLSGMIASSSNPRIKIYMSEWNVWSGLDWRCGLYAGGMLNTFERNGAAFEMGGPALFLRHSSASDWNNALINFNNYRWFPASNYVVMKFWHDHFAPNFLQTVGQNADLNVVSTLSRDSRTLYIKVISTSASPQPVRFNISDSFQPVSVRVDQIAPPDLSSANTMTNRDALKIEAGEAQIEGQSVNGTIPPYGAVILTISQDENLGMGSADFRSIKDYYLYPNHPNPFNSNTVIQYDVPRNGRVTLRILDILGRRVQVLFDGNVTAGHHYITWDGTEVHGDPVSNGVYLCELKTDSQRFIEKLSLLR